MVPGIADRRWPGDALADRLFPFHLLLDRHLVVRRVGRSLTVMCPEVAPGDRFADHFSIVRPPVPIDRALLLEQQDALFVVQDRHGRRLRGQVIDVDGDQLAFLGSPLVTSLAYLKALGLSANHFAVHDSTLDYLLLLESSHTVLADSIRVEAALRREHADLEVAHEHLERLNEELREANAIQVHFLASISHELRTPLHAILGATEVIQDWGAELTAERRVTLLESVEVSAGQLLHIVNDLLDSASIESGRIRIVRTPRPLAQTVRRALDMVRQAAGETSVTIDARIDALDVTLVIDEVRIVEVLVNLLNNAIAHSRGGQHVVLSGAVDEDGVRVAVADQGPGIPLEKQEQIFDKFVRLPAAEQAPRGLGLGLYIARKLARLHGGDVTVASTLGAGSTFTLFLPHQPTQASTS